MLYITYLLKSIETERAALCALGRNKALTEWQAKKKQLLENFLISKQLINIDEETYQLTVTTIGTAHALKLLGYC